MEKTLGWKFIFRMEVRSLGHAFEEIQGHQTLLSLAPRVLCSEQVSPAQG